MNATVEVVQLRGHGIEHLSLHARRMDADERLIEVGRKAWRERFGYDLGSLEAAQLAEVLRSEGWTVTVAEQAVEL